MAEKNLQPHNNAQAAAAGLVPFLIAGTICFAIAVGLGSGGWYIFNLNRERLASLFQVGVKTASVSAESDAVTAVIDSPNTNTQTITNALPAPPSVDTPTPDNPPEPSPIENVVNVAGGEIVLGGGDTGKPIERRLVSSFAIAETEVTNAQYAEFLRATNHSAPPGWKEMEFPDGTENLPVTNVSWRDAVAYCQWLGKKLGRVVRLPNSAEWELAARGREGSKYPWGNQWNPEAAVSAESKGKVARVKNFPLNRSSFGAFDMAGNVWEWTQNKVEKNYQTDDEYVKKAIAAGQTLRLIKGGSFGDEQAKISAQSTYEIPETTKVATVGFRYLVELR